MIKEIIQQWEENKHKLEEYFKATTQNEYGSYEEIVKKIFDICLQSTDTTWETDKMTVIDDGDYQGTKIFIIPNGSYQPSPSDYLMTNTYYGSCSGCDTLQGISNYGYDELPDD